MRWELWIIALKLVALLANLTSANEYRPTLSAAAGYAVATVRDTPTPGNICPYCNGKGWNGDGTVRNKCEPCDGTGKIQLDAGHEAQGHEAPPFNRDDDATMGVGGPAAPSMNELLDRGEWGPSGMGWKEYRAMKESMSATPEPVSTPGPVPGGGLSDQPAEPPPQPPVVSLTPQAGLFDDAATAAAVHFAEAVETGKPVLLVFYWPNEAMKAQRAVDKLSKYATYEIVPLCLADPWIGDTYVAQHWLVASRCVYKWKDSGMTPIENVKDLEE